MSGEKKYYLANLPAKVDLRTLAAKAAEQKARAIIKELRARKMSKAAELVEQAVNETLTYYAFPDIHWVRPRPTPRRARCCLNGSNGE
jgi:transposase-like protein